MRGVQHLGNKKRNTSAEAAPRLAMAADDSAASANVAGNCAPAEFRAVLMLLLLLLLPPPSSSSSKAELGRRCQFPAKI